MKKISGGNKFEWTVFVRPGPGSGSTHRAPLSMKVKSVRFQLHESFPQPVVAIYKEPFEITRTGWGMFEVGIEIMYHNGVVQQLTHMLNFDDTMTQALVPFPEGVGLMRVPVKQEQGESTGTQRKPKKKETLKQGQERTPWEDLRQEVKEERAVKRAVLCLAHAPTQPGHTQNQVRGVVESMGLLFVGCESTRAAMSKIESGVLDYVALVAALGMSDDDYIFERSDSRGHQRSPLLEAATAAGIVAVVYSQRAVSEQETGNRCRKSGASAVVNSAKRLAVAFAEAGVVAAAPTGEGLRVMDGLDDHSEADEVVHGFVLEGSPMEEIPDGVFAPAGEWAGRPLYKSTAAGSDVALYWCGARGRWTFHNTYSVMTEEQKKSGTGHASRASDGGSLPIGVGPQTWDCFLHGKWDAARPLTLRPEEEEVENELPEFLRNVSEMDVELYRTLLSNGKRKLEYAKLMIVGPGRVGKTSMLRQLTGQAFDETEGSTRGVDACSVDVQTWQHSQRGDTTGEAQQSLSVYKDALALTLAEHEIGQRGANTPELEPVPVPAPELELELEPETFTGGSTEESNELDDDAAEAIAAAALEHLAEEQNAQGSDMEPELEQPADALPVPPSEAEAALFSQSMYRGHTDASQSMKKELDDPQVRAAIEEKFRLLEAQKDDRTTDMPERRIMTVLDFAGQRMYYIMHHILMSPRLSVYVVCMSLVRSLGPQFGYIIVAAFGSSWRHLLSGLGPRRDDRWRRGQQPAHDRARESALLAEFDRSAGARRPDSVGRNAFRCSD